MHKCFIHTCFQPIVIICPASQECPQCYQQLHDFQFLSTVSFHRCLHKIHSKDLSFWLFLQALKCPPNNKFRLRMSSEMLTSLDCTCIRCKLKSKQVILLILLVTMCSWFHQDSYIGAVKRNCMESVLLLQCAVTALTLSFHARTSTFSHQAACGYFQLLTAEHKSLEHFQLYLYVI